MDPILKKRPSLGIGLYTIPDVAHILNLDRTLVRRWLREYWGNQFRLKGKSLTAWGKESQGVSAQNIAKSHEIISRKLETAFPFANSQR
jgi:hypothetical protein